MDDKLTFEGIEFSRTPARHGHGDLAEQMAPVSGFVLDGDTRLYLAGDTVRYDTVPETLDEYDPDAVVVNAGAAQFVEGDSITMESTMCRPWSTTSTRTYPSSPTTWIQSATAY